MLFKNIPLPFFIKVYFNDVFIYSLYRSYMLHMVLGIASIGTCVLVLADLNIGCFVAVARKEEPAHRACDEPGREQVPTALSHEPVPDQLLHHRLVQ